MQVRPFWPRVATRQSCSSPWSGSILLKGAVAPHSLASVSCSFIVFVTRCCVGHSTVGAGTVVGSTPFNLCCICGGASLAVGGVCANPNQFPTHHSLYSFVCRPFHFCYAGYVLRARQFVAQPLDYWAGDAWPRRCLPPVSVDTPR